VKELIFYLTKEKGPKALCFEEKSFWTKIQKIQSFIYFGCSCEKSMVERLKVFVVIGKS